MKLGAAGFIGARLTEARESRGVSVLSLSDLVQVSRQTIYAYESGNQLPRADIVQRMATTLRVPEKFFFRALQAVDAKEVLFRGKMSATQAMRARLRWRFVWLQNIGSYLAQFVTFPVVRFPQLNLPKDPAQVTPDMIERAAQDVRSFWGLGSGPISNVTWLLENNGALIARGKTDTAPLDGCSRWFDHVPYVMLVSDKDSAARSRFDAAHELYHLIAGHDPDHGHPAPLRRLMEQQAHRFAGALLLPAESFGRAFYSASIEALLTLKPKWRLSVGMMIARAEQLGFIRPDQARFLWIAYSRRGYRNGEPLDEEIPVERPSLLRQSFELLVQSGEQTHAEILEALPYDPRDIEELAGLPDGFFDVDGPRREESAPGAILKSARARTRSDRPTPRHMKRVK